MPAFLDLVHHYLLLTSDEKEHNKLNQTLIGPPRVNRPTLKDEVTGIVPPSWWRGDDYASHSAMLARHTMKR